MRTGEEQTSPTCPRLQAPRAPLRRGRLQGRPYGRRRGDGSAGASLRRAGCVVAAGVLLSLALPARGGPPPHPAGPDEPRKADAAVDAGEPRSGEVPPEWIREMMENLDLLESLDAVENLELFVEPDLFSPHDF